tara:strand:- start:182 stop:373 length:192 start_codon:yes stop_codon:yes gene_type:complete
VAEVVVVHLTVQVDQEDPVVEEELILGIQLGVRVILLLYLLLSDLFKVLLVEQVEHLILPELI